MDPASRRDRGSCHRRRGGVDAPSGRAAIGCHAILLLAAGRAGLFRRVLPIRGDITRRYAAGVHGQPAPVPANDIRSDCAAHCRQRIPRHQHGERRVLTGRAIDCVLGENWCTATNPERSNRRGDQTRADERRHAIYRRQNRGMFRTAFSGLATRWFFHKEVPSSESRLMDRPPNDSSASGTTNRLTGRSCFLVVQRSCSRSPIAAALRSRGA